MVVERMTLRGGARLKLGNALLEAYGDGAGGKGRKMSLGSYDTWWGRAEDEYRLVRQLGGRAEETGGTKMTI